MQFVLLISFNFIIYFMLSSVRKKSAYSETALLDAIQKGNGKALEILYNHYHHLVFGICLKYLKNKDDAKDVVTEICQKLASEIKRTKIRNFKSWFYVLVRNHCYHVLKENQRYKHISLDNVKNHTHFMEYPGFESPDYDPCDDKTLHKAIEQLKPKQKECITMFYLEQQSYQDITEKTGYDLKQVKSHLQNGRRNLKRLISQNREAEHEK